MVCAILLEPAIWKTYGVLRWSSRRRTSHHCINEESCPLLIAGCALSTAMQGLADMGGSQHGSSISPPKPPEPLASQQMAVLSGRFAGDADLL